MVAPNKTFSELVSLLKLWLPWRSEPDNVSRDFWMPDHSCRGITTIDDGVQVPNQNLSTSPSATSFISTKSSWTANSSCFTLGSEPYPAGPYQQVQPRSILSPRQLSSMNKSVDRPGKRAPKRSNDLIMDAEDPSSNQYEFSLNRSEDLALLIAFS
ncbi:hypothetical protein CRYUN_Cryun31cG0064000 [Craigia yunnanensis]